ncbi:MAG: potassium transporter Kup [Verrucomicrobia bacterium]|nr:potassium transporter Kup [Verrucomicrobiota bacterium]
MKNGESNTNGASSAPSQKLSRLVLGAIGVVFGDIGTSPLYAVKTCFNKDFGVAPSPENILGILSLVFWTITLIVTGKYVLLVLRADNQGEGGMLALMSRILGPDKNGTSVSFRRKLVVILGLCGTALIIADGMITPAISVLSAVEGLHVATPMFDKAVMPIAISVLLGLFLVQKRGTTRIGAAFGPIMIVWFVAIAAMGISWIVREPSVLLAINPLYAVDFFAINGFHGILILGGVVLCITGSEALYADMGHFGRRPIALAWVTMIFPCIALNYFGQGALLLRMNSEARVVENPFYGLAPEFLLYPVVALATMATVIASQALISGVFSLTRQALQLDYCPRLTIVHTSPTIHGQIYMPEVNTILATACIALVLGFHDSSSLAAAYGIAEVGAMGVTSLLMFSIQYYQWKWRLSRALLVTFAFVTLDVLFLLGNLAKVLHGGWFPIAMGVGLLAILTTWKQGNMAITKFMLDRAIPLDEFITQLHSEEIPRVKGTALFIMSHPNVTPRVLLHHLKHNKVLHRQVLLLSVITENVPTVPLSQRMMVKDLGEGFKKITAHCGFMQTLDMREILRYAESAGIKIAGEISYFIGHMTLKTTGRTELPRWRKAIFAFLFHNERSATTFLGIPPNRVVELGEQAEI